MKRAQCAVTRASLAVTRMWLALASLVVAVGALPARAQDFAPAEPAGPSTSAAALLERGLPRPAAPRVEALTTSWLGVPGLVTRAACASARLKTLCAALGWSRTGEPDAGWQSGALALGVATPAGGLAVRALARRGDAARRADVERDGAEVGGGAWLEAGMGCVVWARAPQLVAGGAAPPLARPLAVGVAVERDGIGAWFEREAPVPSGDEPGTHAAGATLDIAGARVWVEARGHPLRAGLGVRVAAIGVRVLSHPRLGDTVTLSLTLPPHGART